MTPMLDPGIRVSPHGDPLRDLRSLHATIDCEDGTLLTVHRFAAIGKAPELPTNPVDGWSEEWAEEINRAEDAAVFGDDAAPGW